LSTRPKKRTPSHGECGHLIGFGVCGSTTNINSAVSTGAANSLADLLQALEDERNLPRSVAVLQKMLARHRDRQTVQTMIATGQVLWADDIACLIVERKIDAGLVPALLPEARVVMVTSPMPPGSPRRWRIRVRLGLQAEGLMLNTLGLPDSGGRWNALSTSRLGGTDMAPEEYLQRVRQAVDRADQAVKETERV